jgi:acetyl-CoA carboxylase biotin carboxyl carrier protein
MNHEQIEGFAALFTEAPRLTEIEIRHEGGTLRMRRATTSPLPARQSSLPTPPTTSLLPIPTSTNACLVTADHVGVIHSVAEVGALVNIGQVLGQIDTMRLLSDCKAPLSGKLIEVLIGEGQPVEYGQPLFTIVPEES